MEGAKLEDVKDQSLHIWSPRFRRGIEDCRKVPMGYSVSSLSFVRGGPMEPATSTLPGWSAKVLACNLAKQKREGVPVIDLATRS